MSFILGWNLSSREISSPWLSFSQQSQCESFTVCLAPSKTCSNPHWPERERAPAPPQPLWPSPLPPCGMLTAHRGLFGDKRLWDNNAPEGTGSGEHVGKNRSSGCPTQRNCLGFAAVCPGHTALQQRHCHTLHPKGKPLPQTKYLSAL